MNVNEVVNDFLRDAQYKVAELTIEMDELDDSGSYEYTEKWMLRHELLEWMDTIYWGRHELVDGDPAVSAYNFTKTNWTDAEIIKECHNLRYKASLNPVPYISWNNYNPQIVVFGSSITTGNQANAAFPVGSLGMYLAYDTNGNVIAQSWPVYAGALESESIFDYFGDRA